MIEVQEKDGRCLRLLTPAGVAEEPGLLIRMAIEQGRYEDAREVLAEAEQGDTGSAEWPMLRAILELRLERNQQAADAFARAERLGACARDCRLGRAGALLGLGAAEEAFEILSSVMSENPADAEVAQWLLRATVATERWSEAAEHLDRYLSLQPDDEAIRFAFASVNARLGRWQLARTQHLHLRSHSSIRGIEDLGRMIEDERCAA